MCLCGVVCDSMRSDNDLYLKFLQIERIVRLLFVYTMCVCCGKLSPQFRTFLIGHVFSISFFPPALAAQSMCILILTTLYDEKSMYQYEILF